MGKTSIEYVDHSVNPIRARLTGVTTDRSGHFCVKVSPGCKNCYASRLQPRFGMPVFQEQRGQLEPELYLDKEVLASVLRRKKPTRYFWCDMTDMFGEWVSSEWIAACFGVMAATPQHTHLVFTKRAKRMREWCQIEWIGYGTVASCLMEAERVTGRRDLTSLRQHIAWPLPNVVLIVSAEDQKRADERIPDLLATPAAVRGVSVEPMLGPVDLYRWLYQGGHCECAARNHQRKCDPYPQRHKGAGWWRCPEAFNRLDWVICGGESGPHARPFDVVAAEDLARQCGKAGVAFYMKQLGAWPFDSREADRTTSDPHEGGPEVECRIRLSSPKGGDPSEWPEDLRVRQMP